MQHFDIIIIGSGAGGGTLAYGLAETGKKILILERGQPLPVEPQNWDPKAVFVERRYRTTEVWSDKQGMPFIPNTHYWLGGNTSFYGAALMRMKRQDFEDMLHQDGVSPKWPISYDELAPYYTQAEKLWRVHGQRGIDPHDEASDPPYPYPPIAHDPGIVRLKAHFEKLGWHPSPLPLGVNRDDEAPDKGTCVRCNTCGGYPCMRLAKSDARTLVIDPIKNRDNVTILCGYRASKLLSDATGKKVNFVECDGPNGVELFSGDIFVVAAGAANSAALFLRSANSAHPNGLANRSDMVGRNYMFHTTSAVVSILTEPLNSMFPKTFAINDFYFGDKDYPYPMGQIQLLEYMSGQVLEGQLSEFLPPEAIPDSLSNELAKHLVAFLTITEDLPKPENRITLDSDNAIVLHYTPNNLGAHRRLTQKLEAGLSHLDLSPYTLFEPNFTLDELLPLYGTAHQCGTLRFGLDPRTSVLDINCKAHDVDNLYGVDSAFFASSSAVNPTLTIVANALRVADHLKSRLA